MTLKLRPDRHLYGAYDYLRKTEPFAGWKPTLPEPDAVRFVVTRERKRQGYFIVRDGFPEIGVSQVCIGSTASLMELMAHELIHLFQWIAKTETRNVQHNAEFSRLAKRVCAAHVFDPGQFHELV